MKKEINVLKVSSKSIPSTVAGAIAGLVRENAIIELDAIGAGAVNQAIKSIAIARGFVASSGYNLVCIPAFGDASVDDEERTMIKLIVKVEI
jgi:stage V sporulation protein S